MVAAADVSAAFSAAAVYSVVAVALSQVDHSLAAGVAEEQ